MQELRRLGYDSATGKTAYVVPEPGGTLEHMADMFALESATVWQSLAAALVDGPTLTADEATFVLARVVEALGEVLPIAARNVENSSAAQYGEAGRDIGAAMRDMKA